MIDLISVFAAAAMGGLLASLLRQPIILGYLLAGVIVGPFELGFIKDYAQVETVAELGVTFLLFTIGVEFSFAELQKVKKIALGGGGLQIFLTIALTVFVSLTMGWVTSVPQGIFLGELISLSSTAVVLKALMEQNETSTAHGQVMLGILIVQDLVLGLMLATLPALNKPVEEIGLAVGIALVKLALFALGAVVVGKWLIPPILQLLAKTESRELFLLGVVTLCLGIALLTGKIGLSTEMGAFVAGLMISEVEYADQTLDYVESLRDICVAAFFAAIGVLIDPVFLWNNLPLILGLVAFVVVGKFLIITPIVRLFGYPLKTAIIAGLGLAQIGEFSFVLAEQGSEFGLISEDVYMLMLGTTAITLIVTPFVLRFLPGILAKGESLPWLQSWLDRADVQIEVAEDLPFQGHVVVCGYGRVGSNIVRLLQERNYPVLVIDQSQERIEKLRDGKIPYIYGNAASLLVLEKAGVSHAKGMAIALPDPMSTRLSIKRALNLNPELDLVVRADQAKDIEMLYQLGAKEVVQPEFEASLELSAHLFSGLGLPLSDIQQDIQQIRLDHYLNLRPEGSQGQVSREILEAIKTLNKKWYSLPDDSPLIGMTLEKTYLRTLTGVSLIAIKRSSGEKIDYPHPQTMINEGDNLLLVGEKDELAAFAALAKGEIALPSENVSSNWLLVPNNSCILGKTVAELNFSPEFGLSIQAIRRKEKYIRFPDAGSEIQAGDRLLLFGNLEFLSQLSQRIASEENIATLVE
ncbi:MAG: cation:proton antiporter [Gomphosphaeria aponina SAG 52.96 = DSM 107014]|uniref:Cation:proton antiporter n=1 Tax=Gomphosphaeria aponina SAG 52.96 = DSM 107014 TaxID=1521640 RepID=A0A941GWJ0_9CHRO|nr:cation:proton antiporter [Gomphosphaeria aponina SAG 52.96 = DSM 107014]